jgi:nitric oxide reductase subunit B
MSHDGERIRSGFWKYALVLVAVMAMTVLVIGGLPSYRLAPPLPAKVETADGTVVSSADLIMGGQAVYLKHGLTNYGSVLGNGSYRGPDFTAQTLRLVIDAMRDYEAQVRYGRSFTELDATVRDAVAQAVIAELETNRYDQTTGTLILTAGQAYALQCVVEHYTNWFTTGDPVASLPPGLIKNDVGTGGGDRWIAATDPLQQLSHYFFWTAWLSAVHRPGEIYSYTNNWPYEPDAGNNVTYGSVFASGISVALLILFLALIFWAFFRYRLSMDPLPPGLKEQGALIARQGTGALAAVLTPSQRAVGKYLVLVILLFLLQTLLGGYLAHGFIASDFFGMDFQKYLPFNAARTWHLQLAIFWIATAWVATGIYLAPALSGTEAKGQRTMVNSLFAALIVVAVGSLLGEWLGIQGHLGELWWWLGTQGWEYIELGRLWQILLAVGMSLWLVIVFRGIRGALRRAGDWGSMVHLLLYAAILIPGFYLFGFINTPGTLISIAEYWRWFVIHLWVEGIFEVFTVVVTAVLFVTMGLVSEKSALRATYFQLLLIAGSGVIGTAHHYYFVGLPEFWLGLGATFSALEVIPLTLLGAEAWEHRRLIQSKGREFPYQVSFWFLIATAVWNLVGAGVLGFLINLPVVNYFEHGTFLTAAHAHGALAGVYGMLALALVTFIARDLTTKEGWSMRAVKIGFWGVNAGLAGMLILTILPVGFAQLQVAATQGFWAARAPEFYQIPWVHMLLWLRMLPDSVLIVVGVLPLLYAVTRAVFTMRRSSSKQVEDPGEIGVA